jgi:hypothetical protein
VVYLETSVALAELLGEDRRPRPEFWQSELIASRLLSYEIWVRAHARGVAGALSESISTLLARVHLVELSPDVLARALEPFPVRIRTIDALHLATLDHLNRQGVEVQLASYDQRLAEAAKALGHSLAAL